MESLICVDRRIAYKFPDWVLRCDVPEFQNQGPERIEIASLGEFPHPEPTGGNLIQGTVLYAHLKKTGLIYRGLNMQDGLALIDTPSFRRLPFVGTWTLLWKSVVQGVCKNWYVPYIQNIPGQTPLIYYYWLEYQVDLNIHRGLLR